jgi:hypothetical protein
MPYIQTFDTHGLLPVSSQNPVAALADLRYVQDQDSGAAHERLVPALFAS